MILCSANIDVMDVIEDIFNFPNPRNPKKNEKILIQRFKQHKGNLKFKKLSDHLVELLDKAEGGLVSSPKKSTS